MSREGWVRIEDVMRHLGVARISIYRWIESQRFPAYHVGRVLRFRLSEVDAWVAKHESKVARTGRWRKAWRAKATRRKAKAKKVRRAR